MYGLWWSATREDVFPAVSIAVSTLLSGLLLEKKLLSCSKYCCVYPSLWSTVREDIFPAVSTAVSTLLSGPLPEKTSSLQ